MGSRGNMYSAYGFNLRSLTLTGIVLSRSKLVSIVSFVALSRSDKCCSETERHLEALPASHGCGIRPNDSCSFCKLMSILSLFPK